MDMIAPLAKTGAISAELNLWLAIPIGFVFGFALFHSGFTDGRRIAWAFYFKDVSVPVVMFSAIVTGMLGLWGLGLIGFLDLSEVYFLPTFLLPMAIGGILFGLGMVIGGYCPGTAIASFATGKIDGLVFVVGFLIGSLFFGDFFPVWGDFYNSDYRGVMRIDEAFGIGLGTVVFAVVVIAVAGSLGMRWVQNRFWESTESQPRDILKLEGALVVAALFIGFVLAFFPADAFIATPEPAHYIVPRAEVGP